MQYHVCLFFSYFYGRLPHLDGGAAIKNSASMGRIKLKLWTLIILLSAVACHSKEELPPPDDLMYFGEYKEFLLDGVIDELKQRKELL